MLALGGRRGDVSYDISHGWIEFEDPGLQLRFTGAPAALAPAPAGKKCLTSSGSNDVAAGVICEVGSHNDVAADDVLQLHPFDC